MTERKIIVCDRCARQHDGNQRRHPVALRDDVGNPIGRLIDPSPHTGPAEHLCRDCWDDLAEVIARWVNVRK